MAVYADQSRFVRAKQKKASSHGFYTNGSESWLFEEIKTPSNNSCSKDLAYAGGSLQ
jgi:hypothetical protein